MTWQKKNQQFALSAGLRPSTICIAQYILRRVNRHKATELTIDLREINRQIGKYRIKGEYDRKTLKQAMAQLNESTYGWFTVIKSYTWSVKTILVRPVDFAIETKSQSEGKPPRLNTGNHCYNGKNRERERELLLQDISKLDSLLQKVGLNYTQDCLRRIWRMAGKKIEEVQSAVEYMLTVHHEKLEHPQCVEDVSGIRSPKGWLHECIKHGWHHLTEAIDLPRFDSTLTISNFVRNITTAERPPSYTQTA